ncbi:MAG TPA: restriction endonuclease subunit S, partial [Gemmatimonadaceae bacterium]
MPGEETVQLRNVCVKIGSGATPRGGREAYKGGATSLIRSQNIYNEGFRHEGLVYIDDDQAAGLRNVEVEPNDVLLNITGDSVARCCQVAADVLPARVNQHVAIIRPQSKSLDARFLRYVLVSHEYQSRLLALASAGATRPALTKTMIEELDVPSPPLAEQKAIAAVLGGLDDKIEVNRHMNATLEAMARAAFKSWFVDFDPVRAQADGRAPAGLDPATAALFPEHFDRSNGVLRPKGWQVSRLGDHVDLVRGNTYKSKLKDLPGPYLLGLGSIHRNGGFRDDSLRTYGGESAPKLILRGGDLFASLKDVTQAADLLGAVARVPSEIQAGRLTQDTVKLVARGTGISFSYLYWTLRLPEYREYCRARATGTTNLGLSRGDFLNYPILVPPVELQRAFDAFESRLDAQIATNRVQSRTLAT